MILNKYIFCKIRCAYIHIPHLNIYFCDTHIPKSSLPSANQNFEFLMLSSLSLPLNLDSALRERMKLCFAVKQNKTKHISSFIT